MKIHNLDMDSTLEDFINLIKNILSLNPEEANNNIIKIIDPLATNTSNELYSHRHLDNQKLEYKSFLKPHLDLYKTPNIFIGNIFLDCNFVGYLSAAYSVKLLNEEYVNSFHDLRLFVSLLYRRFILNNKKIVICIYSSIDHQDKIKKLKNTIWYKDFSRNSNLNFFEIYGGAKNTYSQDGKIFLNVEEGYDKLSLKTFKMIEYFYKYHDFDYLLKIDSSIIDRDSSIRQYTFDNFENNFRYKLFNRDYDGVLNVENHSFRYIRQWAQSKNMQAYPEKIFKNEKIPDFWGGNAYALSRKSCKVLSQNGDTFSEFKKHMCGCEDLCVGYILRKNEIKNWN